MKSDGKIEIVLIGDNAKVDIEGKMNIKEASVTLGKTLGLLLKGYDDDVWATALKTLADALAEQYDEFTQEARK
jgi:hypothetical protein